MFELKLKLKLLDLLLSVFLVLVVLGLKNYYGLLLLFSTCLGISCSSSEDKLSEIYEYYSFLTSVFL